ncbi:MAG: hypothetical protein ACRD5H_09915 [Nitrososphaerales archaeon]
MVPSYDGYAQTPTSIRLLKTFGYLDSIQHYVVFGEVVNEGSPVQFVEIIVQFFDQELNPLTTTSGSLGVEILNSGQISPFTTVLNDEQLAPLVKSFTVTIGNFNTAEEKPKKLDVIFHKIETSGDTVKVTGRIANDGSATSEDTKALIVLYNAVGEPVRYGVAFTEPKNVLPFSSGTFSLDMNVANLGTIAGYAIYSESSTYAEVNRVLKMEEFQMTRVQETVKLIELNAFNQNNQPVGSVALGEPVLFAISLANNILERQEYMYILQIKDKNGFVVSLSWAIDSLGVREDSSAKIAWVAVESGMYEAEAFVWNNLEEAAPLSFSTLSSTLSVT